MPLPCTQANSPLARLTPSSRYVAPLALTRWLPDTCSAGAAPLPPVELGVGVAERLGVGLALVGLADGEVTLPVQAVPLSANDAGTGLEPLHAPVKPMAVEALVASDPFQLMLAA